MDGVERIQVVVTTGIGKNVVIVNNSVVAVIWITEEILHCWGLRRCWLLVLSVLFTHIHLKLCTIFRFLAVFYALSSISEFIIDVLVGSPQSDIRSTAVQQFLLLSQTPICPTECSGHQLTPKQFMLQTLLKARLPFWVASTVTRGASYR